MQTILLVEDEEDLASIVQYHLHKRRLHSGAQSSTGVEALQALNSQSVSLVLLDLMLPDMSGVDICRKIRSNGVLQNLPVIK